MYVTRLLSGKVINISNTFDNNAILVDSSLHVVLYGVQYYIISYSTHVYTMRLISLLHLFYYIILDVFILFVCVRVHILRETTDLISS